jgi:UDP-N-acetylglucosamine 2-epimerase (non-hydrolysing)
MRPNTERPVTITNGTNRLCTIENLESHVDQLLSGNFQSGSAIEFWDGKTAGRIVESIEKLFRSKLH